MASAFLSGAPTLKLEDFVIRSVTQIRLRVCRDPNVAYRPADPRYKDYALIAEQVTNKLVYCALLGYSEY